ncbi:hypothetical protein F5B17DRAFT_92619 [Nemania serpens]|nr:hypothetical protein F5B17DRAFT_92619 [Nemania serpens]
MNSIYRLQPIILALFISAVTAVPSSHLANVHKIHVSTQLQRLLPGLVVFFIPPRPNRLTNRRRHSLLAPPFSSVTRAHITPFTPRIPGRPCSEYKNAAAKNCSHRSSRLRL